MAAANFSRDVLEMFYGEILRKRIRGHAHGVGVQSLIITKFPIFTQIFFVMD